MTTERDIENLLEQQLVQNGWIVEINNPARNVYHQKPKSTEDIRKLNGLEPASIPIFYTTSNILKLF